MLGLSAAAFGAQTCAPANFRNHKPRVRPDAIMCGQGAQNLLYRAPRNQRCSSIRISLTAGALVDELGRGRSALLVDAQGADRGPASILRTEHDRLVATAAPCGTPLWALRAPHWRRPCQDTKSGADRETPPESLHKGGSGGRFLRSGATVAAVAPKLLTNMNSGYPMPLCADEGRTDK